MKVKTQSTQEVSMKDLAIALANSKPEEFAEFWLSFHEACKEPKLDEFAKAMSPATGANRKIVLKRLCSLIEFHDENKRRVKQS